MDVADVREPFRCPAQECRNGRLGTDFGDTKHLYRHWYDTHQPRCPRTDCEFHKRNLSKVTRFYFLRHWGYHYPETITKSGCGKCGGLFVNAANRDRHARKCNGSSASTVVPTQQDIAHSYDTQIVPVLGANTAFGDVLNEWLPDFGDSNASSFVQGGTQTALLDISEWLSSWPAGSSSPSVGPLLSMNDHVSAATISTQHAVPVSQDWLSGSDTALRSEKQNLIGAWDIQNAADFNIGDWLPDTLVHSMGSQNRGAISNADFALRKDARPQTQHFQQEQSKSLWSSLDTFGLSTSDDPECVVNQQTMGLYSRTIHNLPMRIRRQYKKISTGAQWSARTQWVEKRSSTRHVRKHKQVISVKSLVPSRTGFRKLSSEQQIWIHKIVHRLGYNGPKIIETTTSIVNNVLNSKTKYPRIIDDHAPVWQLCATGQYDEVNRLLSQNIVTVFDVDSAGRTLLHVAASYWELDLCRLLLAKGADVEAREWQDNSTSFSLACRELCISQLTRRQPIDYSSNDLADVLALMVQNGTDICAEMELGSCLTYLAIVLPGLSATTPWSRKHKLSRAFSWLLRTHRLVTTCDGVVPNVSLTWENYRALSISGIFNAAMDDVWNLERSDCHIFMPKDTQAIQSFWLLLIRDGGFCGPIKKTTLSSDYLTMYRTDFHYQGLLQDVWERVETSTPLQVALGSFGSFVTFHCILLATGTDPKAFAAIESTMPWCNYTQRTLENLFSVDFDAYEKLKPLLMQCEACRSSGCSDTFRSKGLLKWHEVIALVESGRSLVSLLQFPSEEEERRLHLACYYCNACRSKMAGSFESYDQRSHSGVGDGEDTGFIEGEVFYRFDGDGQSVGDDRVAVDGQASYDESSSSKDSSDDELVQFIRREA